MHARRFVDGAALPVCCCPLCWRRLSQQGFAATAAAGGGDCCFFMQRPPCELLHCQVELLQSEYKQLLLGASAATGPGVQ